MLSRRNAMAGLAALAVMPLTGCASRARIPVTTPPTPIAPPPVPATLPVSASAVDGVIDLSHQAVVSDLALAKSRSNIQAVLHKASEGGDWQDPLYADRRAQAESAGLLWGAYHFGTHQYSGAQQAANFLQAAQPGPCTLLSLDLEVNEHNLANTMKLEQAEEFVVTIFNATGKMPLLYTHPRWADGQTMGPHAGTSLGGAITPNSVLASCDLWVCDYHGTPQTPSAWAGRGWRLWQYCGDGDAGSGPYAINGRAVWGVERCDRNLFLGSSSDLQRYWADKGCRRVMS